ncbi:MAG: GMC family oxidoreductase [Myxococcota bacterium]
MIREGTDWTGDTTEACDVVVIGSGCGGATVALSLAEQGHDVVVLERGGYYPAAALDQRELHALAKIDGGRGLDTSDDGSVQLTYGNNVGGASVHYWADSYRTPADRLDEWRDRYGMQGHDEATLNPWFDRLEHDLRVQPAPDALVNEMNRRFHDGAVALGWAPHRVPQARSGCVGSGFCMQGCSYDAKQSQLVTHLPRAIELGARVYADLDATRLHWRDGGVEAVTAMVLDRATGRPRGPAVRIEARAVVVAAGGYGTPRFLLRQGLKESLPAVGEHLFCNPCPMAHATFDAPIDWHLGIPAAWGVDRFRRATYAPDPAGDRYVEGGYLLMPNQLHPAMLAAVASLPPDELRRRLRAFRHTGGAIAWIDDHERGRMTLEPGGATRLSVWLRGQNALRIRDAWRKQAQLLLAAGAREVWFGDVGDTRITTPDAIDAAVAALDLRPARSVLAAPHPGGGARMGPPDGSSVVGFDHRVHGTRNLYVADPSVFPSAPSVDPSLTIMAFAYVAAAAVHAAL